MGTRRHFIVLTLLIAASSAALFFAQPDQSRNGGWAHSVLRNWSDYGFFRLGGQMVMNPGGHGALEDPHYYTGHRPHVLRAAYFVGCLTGQPGYDGWLFQVLLSLAVGLSIWFAFGKSLTASLLAFCTIVSPGFIRHSLILDTLAIPVLLGIPFLVWSARLLRAQPLGVAGWFLLLLLATTYTAINWTTGMALLIVSAYLLSSTGFKPQRVFPFLIAAGFAAAVVLAISVADKRAGGAGPAEGLVALFNHYLFGSGGYGGWSMDWLTATRRIFVANVIGLAPLLLACSLTGLAHHWRKGFRPIILLPLIAALLCVALFRNYFATHPWMACPVFSLGILASMLSWFSRIDHPPTKDPLAGTRLAVTVVVSAFVYSLAVSEIYRAYATDNTSAKALVRENTARADIIMCDPSVLTQAVTIDWLELGCDRRFLPWSPSAVPASDSDAGRVLLLTKEPFSASGTRIASTETDPGVLSKFIAAPLEWYRNWVAKRDGGEIAPAGVSYCLLEIPTANNSRPDEQALGNDVGNFKRGPSKLP